MHEIVCDGEEVVVLVTGKSPSIKLYPLSHSVQVGNTKHIPYRSPPEPEPYGANGLASPRLQPGIQVPILELTSDRLSTCTVLFATTYVGHAATTVQVPLKVAAADGFEFNINIAVKPRFFSAKHRGTKYADFWDFYKNKNHQFNRWF